MKFLAISALCGIALASEATLNSTCLVLGKGTPDEQSLCIDDLKKRAGLLVPPGSSSSKPAETYTQIADQGSGNYYFKPNGESTAHKLAYDATDGMLKLKVKNDKASWVWLTYEPNSCGSASCPCTSIATYAPGGVYNVITDNDATLSQAAGTFTIQYVDETGADISVSWLNAFFGSLVSYRSDSFQLHHNDVEGKPLRIYFADGTNTEVAMSNAHGSGTCSIRGAGYDSQLTTAIGSKIPTSMWGRYISEGDPGGCQVSFKQGGLWLK